MSITRWNPFAEIEQMLDRYNRDARLSNASTQERIAHTDWAPAVDIKETPEAFEIHAELPGIDKENIKVSVDEGLLTIEGERKLENETDDKKHHRVERFYGKFSRSFRLPENVDEANINAAYKDGVLSLTLLKSEKPQPKAIEVQVH